MNGFLVIFIALQQLKDLLAVKATEFRLVSQQVFPQLFLASVRSLALRARKFLMTLKMVSERLDWDEFSAHSALFLGSMFSEMLKELLNCVEIGRAYGAFIHVIV